MQVKSNERNDFDLIRSDVPFSFFDRIVSNSSSVLPEIASNEFARIVNTFRRTRFDDDGAAAAAAPDVAVVVQPNPYCYFS